MKNAVFLLGVLSLVSMGVWANELQPGVQPRSYLSLESTQGFRSVPFIWDRQVGGKHLTVIGTRHHRDAALPMYGRMEEVLERAQPQLILHEGDAPKDLETGSVEQAVRRGADLGFTVQYAHRHGIAYRGADAVPREEIAALLVNQSARDVFVFLTAQRLIGSESNPNLAAAEAGYPVFLADYLERNGLSVEDGWRTWAGFVREYEGLTGKRLTASTWSRRPLDPTVRGGRLNDVARASAAVRDQCLLRAIREALRDNDRVVVVFGAYHLLALEPVLDRLMGP